MKLNKLNEKTKLRLVIGFFILALAAIIFLIAKNGWLMGSADTLNVQAAAGPVYVPLTKELADAVKAGTPDQAKLDELTSQKLQERFSQIPQSSAAASSRQPESADQSQETAPENFLDAVVVYTDENGQPILPDLEKLKQESAQTRAEGGGVPESNKIDFVIGDGWPDAEKTEIQKIIDEDVPKIREILGPPLFNIKVTINRLTVKTPNVGGAYYPSLNQLYVLRREDFIGDKFEFVLLHEMGHAWRDDLVILSNPGLEESLAQFTAKHVTAVQGKSGWSGKYYPEISGRLANDSSVTTAYRNINSFLAYEPGFMSIAKIYVEDNQNLTRFHNNLYQSKTADATIAKNSLLEALPSTVEGVPKSQWLNSQYILFPSEEIGPHFVEGLLGGIDFYNLQNKSRFFNLEEQRLTRSFTVFIYDSNNKLLSQEDVFGTIPGEYIIGNSTQATPVLNISLSRLRFLHSEKKSGFDSNWYRVTVKDKKTNASKNYVFFLGSFRPPSLVLTDNINFYPNSYLKAERKNVAKKIDVPIAKDAPNAINSLITKESAEELSYNLSYNPDSYFESTIFSYFCSSYNDGQELIKLGTRNYSMNDSRLYFDPPSELKNNSKPTITIESSKDLEWLTKSNQPVSITATVTNSQNQTVKTLKQNQLVDSSITFSWDGNNDKNESQPKGVYKIKVDAVNKVCNTVSAQATFFLKSEIGSGEERQDGDVDPQRKQDLQTLKQAIDTYYSQKGELPGTDGWISGKDAGPNTNESLAETLLPAKVIDVIPCDPAVSSAACQTGGTENNRGYVYHRDDYCGGSKDTYSLYATLDNPSQEDKATLDASAKCNSHSDITGNSKVNYRIGGNMVNDKQRKADLAKLKVAIDKYYEQKKELPGTDGWISSVDFLKQNDSLAETLLPAAVIDKIPVDPTATGPGGNGGYIYYRDDYCDGDKYTYSLYAQLDNPSAQDKETMKSGAKCNSHSDITGNPKVNYRLGATIPKPDYETTTISGKGAKIYPVSKLPEKYQEILKVKLIKGWNMVSIPFGIEKKEANKGDFDGLPQFNSYLPGQNKYQQETVNQPGSGYLINSPAPKEYAITNVDKVKILDDDPLVGQFEIPLKKGWNLIGNPYLRETDTANWQVKYTDRLLLLFRRTKTVDFALAATYINPKLMIMNNQQYADATKLAPYQGAWIYSYKDGVTLLIP